jgi:hypothetical protein
VTFEPYKYNDYSYELTEIIEFDYPKSKDWVKQNISFDGIWGAPKKLLNQFVQCYMNNLQRHFIIHNEIHDGPHPIDDPNAEKEYLSNTYRYGK